MIKYTLASTGQVIFDYTIDILINKEHHITFKKASRYHLKEEKDPGMADHRGAKEFSNIISLSLFFGRCFLSRDLNWPHDWKDGIISVGKKVDIYEMLCAIWYHLYNFKNLKNTRGGVLLLVKLQGFSLQLF